MGVRGGEEKGKRELGGRERKHRLCPGISPGDGAGEGYPASAAFGSVFRLFGQGPGCGDGCVLWGLSDKFLLQGQVCLDKVSAASPTQHPPAKQDPLISPFLTSHPVGTQKLV